MVAVAHGAPLGPNQILFATAATSAEVRAGVAAGEAAAGEVPTDGVVGALPAG